MLQDGHRDLQLGVIDTGADIGIGTGHSSPRGRERAVLVLVKRC